MSIVLSRFTCPTYRCHFGIICKHIANIVQLFGIAKGLRKKVGEEEVLSAFQ